MTHFQLKHIFQSIQTNYEQNIMPLYAVENQISQYERRQDYDDGYNEALTEEATDQAYRDLGKDHPLYDDYITYLEATHSYQSGRDFGLSNLQHFMEWAYEMGLTDIEPN